MVGCTELTVGTTGKKYACINGTCQEALGGPYTEPTCGGTCGQPQPGGDSTLLIFGAAALLGAFLIFGRDKK